MAPREWQKVTILDEQLSRMFVVGPQGLSELDQEALTALVPLMTSGDVDAVSLVPAQGVRMTGPLSERVNDQVSVALAGEQFVPTYGEPPKGFDEKWRIGYGNPNAIYNGLHYDVRLSGNMNDLAEPGFRFHFAQGSFVRKGNIPSGFNFSDFDPFLVLGRVAPEVYGRQERLLSHETFVPSVVVDQRDPVWTLFRNTGSYDGPNFPVAHTLIPPMTLDFITDPDVVFSDLQGSEQTAMIATATDIVEMPLRSGARSPFSKPNPSDPEHPHLLGHRRMFTTTDFTSPNSEPRR